MRHAIHPRGMGPGALRRNPAAAHTALRLLSLLSLLLPALSHGQWLDTTLAVGTNPNHLVFNPLNNRVYTANWGTTGVAVIDGAANSLIATVPVGSYPHSLCYNRTNNRIYTANPYAIGDNLAVIDGASNSVIATVRVGTYPYRPLHNPISNRVYTANWSSNNVTVIDGATNAVVATITLGAPGPLGPQDLGFNPINNKVYCANWANNTVTIIDGATNAVIRTVQAGSYPSAFLHNPATNRMYWANSGASSSSVTVMDGATDSVLATIPVARVPYALAYNHADNKVYCANQWRDTVTVIDGATNSILRTIPVGDEPSALLYNPTNNTIYCANSGTYSSMGRTVTLIDGATDSVRAVLEVGNGPEALAYNPQYNRVYVANYYGNSVSVIRDVQPRFSVSSVGIDFGQVPVGSSAAESVVVVNAGPATLIVSGAASSYMDFVVTPASARVAASDSAAFTVTFTPSSAGTRSGAIIFTYNAPESPDSLPVSGNGIVSAASGTDSLPAAYGLAQNYPNPFNSATVLSYTVARASFVSLRVYSVLGEEVAVLVDGRKQAGTHDVQWDAGDSPSGVYFCRLQAEGFTRTRKLLLLR